MNFYISQKMKILNEQPNYDRKLQLLFMWIKQHNISFKNFKILLNEIKKYSGTKDPESIMG